jgi:hypothetical protein
MGKTVKLNACGEGDRRSLLDKALNKIGEADSEEPVIALLEEETVIDEAELDEAETGVVTQPWPSA